MFSSPPREIKCWSSNINLDVMRSKGVTSFNKQQFLSFEWWRQRGSENPEGETRTRFLKTLGWYGPVWRWVLAEWDRGDGASLVRICSISFQIQQWIRNSSCKELPFFPEETSNSWWKRVIEKFLGSFQDLKQDSLLITHGSPFSSHQDPDQEVHKSWRERVIEKDLWSWQDWRRIYIRILFGFHWRAKQSFSDPGDS
jgi:hypothetical protein